MRREFDDLSPELKEEVKNAERMLNNQNRSFYPSELRAVLRECIEERGYVDIIQGEFTPIKPLIGVFNFEERTRQYIFSHI